MDSSQSTENCIAKFLNIIQINVNSLIRINRRYDLNNFIKTYNADLVLLNETKLNSKHKL